MQRQEGEWSTQIWGARWETSWNTEELISIKWSMSHFMGRTYDSEMYVCSLKLPPADYENKSSCHTKSSWSSLHFSADICQVPSFFVLLCLGSLVGNRNRCQHFKENLRKKFTMKSIDMEMPVGCSCKAGINCSDLILPVQPPRPGCEILWIKFRDIVWELLS